MKYVDLSIKYQTSPRWLKFAAMSVMALAIAGCGGGSDGVAPAPLVPPVVAPPVVVDVLTTNAVIAAAAANPAATNTASNPAQAFSLIDAVGAPVVSVQNPPVVNFTVVDAAGKFVPGLTLAPASSAAKAADTNCGGNNLTFAMAKFEGGNWQSLISRQRLDADVTTPAVRYAVVEGTTDPKPTDYSKTGTAARVNPASAVTDPATRIVGILEENAANGYYTYRFATDVTTPLLMANAVAGRSVADSSATATNPAYQNRIANNGKLAVKDGTTIHRIGAQVCYTDPLTKAKVVINPYIDFTLGANGIGVLTKALDGSLKAARKVVDKTSCNECHSTLTAHGTRIDPNYCVVCHNSGSTDYNTKNPIDLKLMVHKFHMGKELTQDYRVTNSAGGNAKTTTTDPVTLVKTVTGFGYSQDVKNCVKCHTGTAAPAGATSGTTATADGDNWKRVPGINACGSCHDGINFATGQGLTLKDAKKGLTVSTYGHIGGAKQDDTQCIVCHTAADTPVYHSSVLSTWSTAVPPVLTQSATPTSLPAGAAKFDYEIKAGGVTVAGTPKRATVVFRILQNGNPVTFNTFAAGGTVLLTGFSGGPTLYLGYAVPQDGIAAPADFNASASSSVQNIWDGTKGTLTGPDGSGYYTATLGKTTTNGLDIPDNAVMVTAFMGYAAFTQTTGLSTAAYPNGLRLISQAVQQVATGYSARREIVSAAKCSTCHEKLGIFTNSSFHSGYRNDPAACALCHTPNRTSNGWSADSGGFIHAVHGSGKRAVPFTWAAASVSDTFAGVGYPGVLKNCESCHVAGSYDFSAPASAAAVSKRLYRTTAQGVFNTSTSPTLLVTFDANGVAKTGGTTSLTPPSAATAALSLVRVSPYVVADNATDYGIGFSYTAYRAAAAPKTATATTMALPAVVSETGVTRQAAPTTLVSSPIAAACFSCHDSSKAQIHMNQDGGGSIYQPRTVALAKTERCLDCHAAGKASDIKVVHAK